MDALIRGADLAQAGANGGNKVETLPVPETEEAV